MNSERLDELEDKIIELQEAIDEVKESNETRQNKILSNLDTFFITVIIMFVLILVAEYYW